MEYKVRAGEQTDATGAVVVNLRCPVCHHSGAFHGLPNCNDGVWLTPLPLSEQYRGGVRRCPNLECNAIVFVVTHKSKLLEAFPPEVIDFDATSLPPKILATLEEAIRCHASKSHKATALMVRRVLEELCEDKNATGADLKARLQNLGGNIVVPPDLLAAAGELRLLGNDAAHVRAKDYDAIGEKEATLAVQLAKELLKATYQYSKLVADLQALKKT